MDVNVCCAWRRGVREFRGTRISDGIYDMVFKILLFIRNQQGGNHTAVINCKDLLRQMQNCCNHGLIKINFVAATAQLSQPQPQSPQPGPSRKRQSSTELDEGPSEKRTREEASPPIVPAPPPPVLSLPQFILMWSPIQPGGFTETST